MRSLRRILASLFLVLLVTASVAASFHGTVRCSPHVILVRTPNGGIQPQTVLDRDGVLHMIYFIGNAAGGDIEYVRREAEGGVFSEPIRVNSVTHSAIAIGTVRGP